MLEIFRAVGLEVDFALGAGVVLNHLDLVSFFYLINSDQYSLINIVIFHGNYENDEIEMYKKSLLKVRY